MVGVKLRYEGVGVYFVEGVDAKFSSVDYKLAWIPSQSLEGQSQCINGVPVVIQSNKNYCMHNYVVKLQSSK